jgi:FkbM family methyltransferase
MVSKAQQMINNMDMIRILMQRGFQPNSVIDCGASVGDWTKATKNALPHAQFLMIEPREACRKHLEPMVRENVKYVRELLDADTRIVEFYDHGEQSSMFRNANNEKWGEITKFSTIRLDNLAANMPGPILLKLDLQGAELAAIFGAENILSDVEVIFMEVTLFPFMVGMPLITDVLVQMDELGFMVYDIFDKHTRPIDGRVGQFDVCFVAKSSQLVANNRWSEEW